jgi:hypothetical protein
MRGLAWWRNRTVEARRAGAVTVAACATVGALACGALSAYGETGPASDTGGSACPPSNGLGTPRPVTEIAAGVGASQSTPRGTRFPLRFAVTVTDAEKTPVPGVLVMFAAPARGPSGHFTVRSRGSGGGGERTSHPRRVGARTDACGVAVAPPFTADDRQGGYVVTASVEQLRAAFALVNEGP